MLSDRQLIETDKSALRRQYRGLTGGLAALRAYAATLWNDSPSDVEITSTSVEGTSGSGTVSNGLRIRRIAVEELIAELDPEYIEPVVRPGRPWGVTVRLGC